MGKTHMVEFAFGGTGHNSHWGAPYNPWDSRAHRALGGSSSGAEVSLLEGSALLAFGTDTAGSVRIPACMTGTVGLKVTLGRWPTEGVQHLTHAIELTRSLPTAPDRDRREPDLHLALGRMIRMVKGMAAPDTLHVFSRARELLDEDTSVEEHITVLYGLWGVHYVRAEHAGRPRGVPGMPDSCRAVPERRGRRARALHFGRYAVGNRCLRRGAVPSRPHPEIVRTPRRKRRGRAVSA